MKKAFLSILTLSFIFMMSCKNKDNNAAGVTNDGFVDGSSTVNNIAVEDSLKWTEIQWIDTLKDLGTLEVGAPVEINFRFKNIGKKPLSINNVTAGCGCTSPQKPSKLIAPGEESIVRAKFKTEGQSGNVRKHITVQYNGKNGVRDLEFTANVIPKK